MRLFEPAYDTTLADALNAYLERSRSMGLMSAATIERRRFELKRLAAFCEERGVQVPHRLHRNLVTAYLGTRKVAQSTRSTILAQLSAYFTYLVDEGLLLENPLEGMKRPRPPRVEADYLSEPELDALFRAVAEGSWDWQVERNLLLLSLLSILCLRVSEALGLTLEDLDLKTPCLWVRRKGGAVERLPCSAYLVERIEAWLEVRQQWAGSASAWLFLNRDGERLGVRSAQKLVARFLGRAGLVKRSQGPHLLRHSGASIYLKRGTDIKTVQKMLGHRDLSTTSRYVHSDAETLARAVCGFLPPGDRGTER